MKSLQKVKNELWKRFVDTEVIEEKERIILSFNSDNLSEDELERQLLYVFNNNFEDLNLMKEADKFVCFFDNYDDVEETLYFILNEKS